MSSKSISSIASSSPLGSLSTTISISPSKSNSPINIVSPPKEPLRKLYRPLIKRAYSRQPALNLTSAFKNMNKSQAKFEFSDQGKCSSLLKTSNAIAGHTKMTLKRQNSMITQNGLVKTYFRLFHKIKPKIKSFSIGEKRNYAVVQWIECETFSVVPISDIECDKILVLDRVYNVKYGREMVDAKIKMIGNLGQV